MRYGRSLPSINLDITTLYINLKNRSAYHMFTRLLMAEAVEKAAEVKIFETIIQNSGLRRINIAASAAQTNNSCAKFDGPDYFNTLG